MNRAVSSSYLLVLVLFCTSSFRGQLPEGRACIFKDAKPKKAELQTLGITDDIVDYSSYSRVGTCLLNDENGNKIKKLEVDYGSVTPRIEEIFRLWMNGNGATPVSWVGLVACLKPAQLNTIIERIESEYCLMGKADSHSGCHSTDEGCTKDSQTRILTGIINIMVSSYIFFIVIAIIIVITIGALIGCWKHFGRGKRDLHILITGTVGAGKSALVNSIIGEYYADEDDSPQKETTKVIKYEKRAGNFTISIYESPGLQLEDDNEAENQYVNCVEEDCSEVDLNLYCVKMSDRIRPSAVDAVKKLCYVFGKKEFQQKTLFVLTFANDITVPNQKLSSMLVQHFGDQIVRWKILFQKALINKAGISEKAAANVPVVPAGYYDNLLLPAAKCDNWLRKLWFHILVGLKFDNLHVENDRSWEAAMIAYLQSKGRDNLRVCVIGRTGTGKSALVNSMVGRNDTRAEEGDTASRVTAVVTRYRRRIGDSDYTIFIYDSPGLHDDKEIADQYLKDIEENCGEADLNLYCVRMNNKMQPSEIDAIKKFSYAFGKNEFWHKTLFVLTFANEIVLPKQKISSMLLQHFRDQMSGWKTLLEKALTEKVGISKEAAANVPVVPAGYHDKLSLPAANCDNWLSKLRTQCFNQIKDMARPISSRINWGQLQPSEEVKKEDITKKTQPKQPNTDQGIAYEA